MASSAGHGFPGTIRNLPSTSRNRIRTWETATLERSTTPDRKPRPNGQTEPAMIRSVDFPAAARAVCIEIWGRPTAQYATHWRFGNRQSKSLHLESGRITDFEADWKGGVLDAPTAVRGLYGPRCRLALAGGARSWHRRGPRVTRHRLRNPGHGPPTRRGRAGNASPRRRRSMKSTCRGWITSPSRTLRSIR